MNRTVAVAAPLLALFLSACAQSPQKPAAESPAKPPPAAAIPTEPTPKPPALPDQELTNDILYRFLIGEVAGQRGRLDVATQAYLEMARKTQDPRIAQRATEVALFARAQDQALEAARIWVATDPDSVRAQQALTALLVNSNKLTEAKPLLEKLLREEKANVGPAFLQLSSLLSRSADRKAALQLVRELAQPYPNVAEAHIAVSQAALGADDLTLAAREAEEATKLRPDWELAALIRGQVLQRRSNAEALAYWKAYLKEYPQAKDVRLNYARLLVNDRNYEEARKEFEQLGRDFPQNADVTMAVALLAIELKDYAAAEQTLKRALTQNPKEGDSIRLYLGQVDEERKHYEDAKRWYQEVGRGDQYIPAQMRYAGVLAKEGDLTGARRYLQQLPVQNNQQRVQLIQAEAQLLRDQNQYQEAYDLLGRSLDKLPNYPDLLYDYAMAAEKVNRVDVLEANLKKLIVIKPDHAHAYNALGYTLADRNERLKEAEDYIDKALKIAPDDPFILDSKGWVLYRRGQPKEALVYLRRAFAERPDPEIAAHLGEVLWAQGQKDEAEKVWRQALQDNPDNEALQAAVKRFLP
ncbi:MAG TPA: tetratricopeptide repeat protein [Burkholderiales bacterium]|nr:tetratricopeptide repeat protein [Betaproteobacteria bacterium]HQR52280.1 tetratricopeptide repeat protein [Burkholderiales bacterium]